MHPHTNVHTHNTATYTLAVRILMKEGRVMREEACEAGIDKFYDLREVAEESERQQRYKSLHSPCRT